LDYLWADLPIIATKGDSLADLIAAQDLGVTVDPENPEQLVAAITLLADDKPRRAAIQRNIKATKEAYRWSNVVKPIVAMVKSLEHIQTERLSPRELSLLARSTTQIFEGRLKEEGFTNLAQGISRKLVGFPKKSGPNRNQP
jgi:hypothetical protein